MSVRSDNRMVGVIHSAVRLVIGALFALHGVAGIFGVLGMRAAVFGVWPSWWASAIELVGGLLVALGLFTRAAAVICSGTMAYAYFTVHIPHSLFPMLNGGEPAALYSWAFLLVAAIGAGPISLDALLRSRKEHGGESAHRLRATVAASSESS